MENKNNTMYDQTNTAPYPTNPTYGAPANNPYPPLSTAYPPPASGYPPSTNAYPPSENVYPPTTSAYPPPMSSYPPPMAAPPPYTATAQPYEPQTQTTNTTVVVAINNQNASSHDLWTSQVGFDSKTVRLGKCRK